jgi:hypothetical protein
MPEWFRRYVSRHQHPVSIALHIIGIPRTIAAVILAVVQLAQWRWDLWWRPLVLLGAGFLLQWVGHRVEGNTLGEIIMIREWLGLPYVAVSPRYAPTPTGDGADSNAPSPP